MGLLLLFLVNRSERERRSALDEVAVGVQAARVSEVLGIQPTMCPADSLDHLRESFPDGWSPAAIDVALEALQSRTAELWAYPIDDAAVQCGQDGSRTEVGVAQDRTVAWIVPVLGRSALELPPSITPSGVDSLLAEQQSQ